MNGGSRVPETLVAIYEIKLNHIPENIILTLTTVRTQNLVYIYIYIYIQGDSGGVTATYGAHF
jgi:hypothetical protein